MLNFSKTEKSLKHWLKNKVTITTSTVIGFLIMGTISFGAAAVVKGETQKIESDTTLSQPIEVIKQDETVGVSIEKENIKLTNDSTVTAISKNTKAFGIKSDVKANVINNRTITAKALNEDKTNGLDTATKDIATGIALNKGGKAENNSNIYAEGYRATGIEAKDGAFVINNKGAKIEAKSVGKVDNNQGRTAAAYGLNLNNSIGINHGTIETTSGELSQGVRVEISKDFNSNENVFENYGTIVATLEKGGGGSSNAISVKSETDKKITIVNKKDATLETNDNLNNKNSATVRIEKGNVSFINDGIISTKNNGKGIYAVDERTSVVNNGKIEVTGNEGVGVFSTGEFTNNKTINVNTDNAIGVQSNNKVINSKDGNITVNSKSGTGILLKGKGVAENAGNINVTGDEKAYGVELVAKQGVSTANFLNTGNITVNSTNNDNKNGIAYGIYLENGATATNNGIITATSPDRAAGVDIYLDKNYKGNTEKLFVNEKGGTITASSTNGATANAISVKNYSTQKVAIENNGTLISTGKNGTNTENGKPLYNPVVDLAGKNVEFTNKGTIIAGDGVGIQLNGTDKLNATNTGTIEVNSTGKAVVSYGTATNTGIIKITDKTAEQLKNEKFDTSSLFSGNVTDKGMISDKDGYAVIGENTDTIAKVEITTGELNNYKDKVYFGKYDGSTIVGDESPTSIDTLNIIGNVEIKDGTNEVHLAVNSLNFDKNGQFNVKDGNSLYLGDENKEININSAVTGEKIIVGKGSELALQNANVNKEVNISGEGSIYTLGNTTIASNVTSKEFEVFDGNTLFNGKLSTDTVTVGHDEQSKDTKLTLSSGASFGKETDLNTENGTTVFEIGAKGENALANSTGAVTVNGNVDFDTNKLTTNTIVELNNKKDNVVHNLNGAKYQEKTNEVYNTHLDKTNNTLEFAYNKSLYNNSKLNDLNNVMQGLNDKLSQNVTERSNQLDEIYSGNIYSETVRAAYDNVKLNEEAVLSLSQTAKAGETKTFGKLLYNKDKYTREGILNDYDAKVETTGLLAGAEYGVSDTTAVGAVFSGAKQDIDLTNGNADSDVFYLGLYGTKILGNYDFTAGLGYQFGKYDSDYNMAKNLSGSEKYDSNAINAYVQGRYTADLGDGVSLQPKVKLGYTYVEQDDVKDNNYEVKNTDISTFDTEVGVDVVKAVQLDKANLTLKAGTSYIKTMGDTDKKFTLSTTNGSAEILGAELAENVVKFGVDAKVEIQNGLFYNVGADYRFGSQDTKSYSVNVGLGYKF